MEGGEDLLIELIMPIISRVISKLEGCQSHLDPRAASLHVGLSLANSMTVTIISEYFELHGNKDVLGTDSTTTLTKLFDQWVPLLQESAAGTTTGEYQLTQMFDHANTGAYVHRSAPQEPRTPEQATHTIPAVTPPKLELRALLDIPREPEDSHARIGQEEALLVVAMYGAE